MLNDQNYPKKELLPCPFCGGKAFVATIEHSEESRPNGYRFHGQIMCRNCQATAGTTGFDLVQEDATRKAAAAWNRRADQQREASPKPLTLEELRERDGKPVWVVDFDSETRHWDVFITSTKLTYYFLGGAALCGEEYGLVWTAYDREVKEGEECDL